MKKALLISALASNQGKTLLTTALLEHYKTSVRPYKCGPDFIDPQFHEKIAKTPSINLDGFMMDENQLRWTFNNYFDKNIAILEGVMGFYDGMDKNSSAYDISKTLEVSTVLVVDGSGSYITISAILKGMLEFRKDNTIKGVVLNKLSSKMHYELIKKNLEKEVPNIVVCGWIEKDLESLSSTHLGLDLQNLEVIENVTKDVLKNIDLELLESLMSVTLTGIDFYPFEKIKKQDKLCVVVKDKNFSFLYYDNLMFLRECYKEVVIVDSTKDEKIVNNADIVVIVGGYVETKQSYERVKNSHNFKNSLILHVESCKPVYAECAGLIYLGQKIDEKPMSGILPITFSLEEKRQRLGYYKCDLDGKTIKGHAFHYSKIQQAPKTDIKLYKVSKKTETAGGYVYKNVFATYLHTMWRVHKPKGL